MVGRRCLVLGPVELLLTLLSRRAVRMFRTAGYGAGAAAVIRSAIHRSVIHRPSLRRRPRSSRSPFFLPFSFLSSPSSSPSPSPSPPPPAPPRPFCPISLLALSFVSLSLSRHVDRRVLEIRDRLGTNGTGQRILSDRSLPPLFAATMILTRSAAETSRREKSGRSRIDRSASRWRASHCRHSSGKLLSRCLTEYVGPCSTYVTNSLRTTTATTVSMSIGRCHTISTSSASFSFRTGPRSA